MVQPPGRRGLVVILLAATLATAPHLLPEPVAEASFPGGNGKIAYATNDASCSDVIVMFDDGSDPAPLSTTDCDEHPDWSPDGTKIVVDRSTGPDSELVVMNADGTNAHAITNNNVDDQYPAWTPDGDIVFERQGTGDDIYRIGSNGGTATNLTNGGSNQTPAVSVTGEIAWKTGDGDIWVMNADGSGKHNITNTPDLGEFHPNWSPDGTKIAYMRRNLDFTDVDLFVMNADGTEQQRLPCGPVFAFTSAFFEVSEFEPSATITVTRDSACDPSTVNYATSPGSADPGDFTPTSGTLTFAEGEHTKTFEIPINNDTTNEADETVLIDLTSPCWNRPLGSSAEAELTISDDDFGPPDRPLRTRVSHRSSKEEPDVASALPECGSAFRQEPAWSPDGTKIAFVSDRDGDNEIYVGKYFEGPDGPGVWDVRQLTDNTADDDQPTWQHRPGSLRLTGKVTDAHGDPLEGWNVGLTGNATESTKTGGDGRYSFTISSGNYTVTPQDDAATEGEHLFFPQSRTLNVVEDTRGVNFVAGWTLFVFTADGGGTVTSSPGGVDCGGDCVHTFAPGAGVWLTATPDSEHYFNGWLKSDCSGTGSCHVTKDSPTSQSQSGNPRHEVVAIFSVKDVDPLAVATIVEIVPKGPGPAVLEFFRDGAWQTATVGTQLHIDDKLRTDDNTTAALEFSIGGRAGLRQGSEVKFTHERQVEGVGPVLSGVKLTQGGIWMKCDKLKEPMEIQTNGGVMGIKG